MPLKRLTGVLIDLSGTLHVGDTPIKGAVEAIDRLRRAGIPVCTVALVPRTHTHPQCQFRFCTNTTKEGKGSLQERLSRVGISAKEEEVGVVLMGVDVSF
jgi:ribonucleotide monophosphatase NagD (HAD superfamily)